MEMSTTTWNKPLTNRLESGDHVCAKVGLPILPAPPRPHFTGLRPGEEPEEELPDPKKPTEPPPKKPENRPKEPEPEEPKPEPE